MAQQRPAPEPEGFRPIQVTPTADKTFRPIEVGPTAAPAVAPAPVKAPAAGGTED